MSGLVSSMLLKLALYILQEQSLSPGPPTPSPSVGHLVTF